MTAPDTNMTFDANPQPPSENTVLAALVLGNLAAARAFGLDADRLAAAAGLSEAELSDPDGRVPFERHTALLEALRLSLITSVAATLAVMLLGLPVAYLLATRSFAGKRLIEAMLELPMVLPPTVAGVGLVIAGEDLDQRRLPRSVLPDESVHLTGGDVDAHVVERDLASEGLRQVFDPQCVGQCPPSPARTLAN